MPALLSLLRFVSRLNVVLNQKRGGGDGACGPRRFSLAVRMRTVHEVGELRDELPWFRVLPHLPWTSVGGAVVLYQGLRLRIQTLDHAARRAGASANRRLAL